MSDIDRSLLPAWSDAFAGDSVPVIPSSGIGVDRSWAFDGATGRGVRVAIVDSGIDFTHPRLAGASSVDGVAMAWDREAQEVVSEPGPHEDLYGHGTACAEIVRRAAPDAELMSVRVLGARLSGKGPVFAEGLRWAVAAGARVVNLSLSTGRRQYYELFHEIADAAYYAGVVLVCAMNNVPAETYPGQFASVISVAACPGTDPFLLYAGSRPPAEFGAPGIDLEMAWLAGGTVVATGNSFAAPHVTGLVARLLSKHPHLQPFEVKAVLRAVAHNTR